MVTCVLTVVMAVLGRAGGSSTTPTPSLLRENESMSLLVTQLTSRALATQKGVQPKSSLTHTHCPVPSTPGHCTSFGVHPFSCLRRCGTLVTKCQLQRRPQEEAADGFMGSLASKDEQTGQGEGCQGQCAWEDKARGIRERGHLSIYRL